MMALEFIAERAEYAGGSDGEVVVRIEGHAQSAERTVLGQPTLIVADGAETHRVEAIARETPAFVEVGPDGATWTAAFSLPARVAVAASQWWLEPGPELDEQQLFGAGGSADPSLQASHSAVEAPAPTGSSIREELAAETDRRLAQESAVSSPARAGADCESVAVRVDRLEDRLDKLLFALAGLEEPLQPRARRFWGGSRPR
jgi:hypothetical protein